MTDKVQIPEVMVNLITSNESNGIAFQFTQFAHFMLGEVENNIAMLATQKISELAPEAKVSLIASNFISATGELQPENPMVHAYIRSVFSDVTARLATTFAMISTKVGDKPMVETFAELTSPILQDGVMMQHSASKDHRNVFLYLVAAPAAPTETH